MCLKSTFRTFLRLPTRCRIRATCNSNLVVGFLIAPSRHGHIKYLFFYSNSNGIIFCQSFVSRRVLSRMGFCDKFSSSFSTDYYRKSLLAFASGFHEHFLLRLLLSMHKLIPLVLGKLSLPDRGQ